MTQRCYSVESDISDYRTGVAVGRPDPADDERRQLNELFQEHVVAERELRRRSQPAALSAARTDRRSWWQRFTEALWTRQ